MHGTDALGGLSLAELRLDDLVADATKIQLPAPRTASRVIDLTKTAARTLTIPDATVSLVDGYADYGS
jgi:hypothetical protein